MTLTRRYRLTGIAFGLLLAILFLFSACTENEIVGVELKKFTLLSPASGARDIDTKPTFSWLPASEEGVTYTLTISNSETLEDPIFQILSIPDTGYIAEFALDPATTYFWTIEAVNEVGEILKADDIFLFRTLFGNPDPTPEITSYFVSPDGSDSPHAGSKTNPFRSLAYASRLVPPNENDTIFLTPGEYYEKEPALIGLRTNIQGAGPLATILKSDGVELTSGANPESSTYKEHFDGSLIQLVSEKINPGEGAIPPTNGDQRIAGFTIDGMNKQLKAGIWVENRNNITIGYVNIQNCDYRGVVVSTGNVSGTKSHFLTGIKIHDCSFENSGKELPDETLGNLCLSSLDGAEVYNIDISDQEGYGIKFIYRGYFKNCTFRNIRTHLNEHDSKWGEKIAIELWNLGPGNEIYEVATNTWLSLVNDSEVYGEQGETLNLRMHNIKIIDQDSQSENRGVELALPHALLHDIYIEDKGIGIAVWDMGRENITIRNSIFRNSSYKTNWAQGPAIYIDNSRSWDFDDIYIYHNVFEMHNVAIMAKGTDIEDIYIKNNLIIETGAYDISNLASANFFIENNFKSHTKGTDWKFNGSVTETSNLTGDPMVKLTGPRWGSYYVPIVGSPLIDNGTDIGLPHKGSAPDIGTFETK